MEFLVDVNIIDGEKKYHECIVVNLLKYAEEIRDTLIEGTIHELEYHGEEDVNDYEFFVLESIPDIYNNGDLEETLKILDNKILYNPIDNDVPPTLEEALASIIINQIFHFVTDVKLILNGDALISVDSICRKGSIH